MLNYYWSNYIKFTLKALEKELFYIEYSVQTKTVEKDFQKNYAVKR